MRDIRHSFVYGHYLRQIVFRMMHAQDERLAPYNITSQQARVMGFIRQQQEERGNVCQKDLEVFLGLRGSSVTSLVKGLEKRGYIRREPGETDGRVRQLSLTEKGQVFHDTFMEIFQETERKVMEALTPQEQEQLLELLTKAAKSLE